MSRPSGTGRPRPTQHHGPGVPTGTRIHVQVTRVCQPLSRREAGGASTWHTTRRILAIEDGGPCHDPAPVVLTGRQIRFIPCGRILPAPQRCPACTRHIIVTSVRIVLALPGPTRNPDRSDLAGPVSRAA